MNNKIINIERYEIDLLLDVIFNQHGYDFRNYAKASLSRRIKRILDSSNKQYISELIPLILYDNDFINRILIEFSISVTEMFRDPQFWISLRSNIIPYLKTFPYIKIWHAGCSTGEEVYSLAILLKEEGLLERTTFFATDFNEISLRKARTGKYPLELLEQYNVNYKSAGGKTNLSEYYTVAGNFGIFSEKFRKRITYANHNLSTDSSFGHMNLILCRNVLIYFNKDLQNQVFNLFYNSLLENAFLAIGSKETLDFSTRADSFKSLDIKNKIYQRMD